MQTILLDIIIMSHILGYISDREHDIDLVFLNIKIILSFQGKKTIGRTPLEQHRELRNVAIILVLCGLCSVSFAAIRFNSQECLPACHHIQGNTPTKYSEMQRNAAKPSEQRTKKITTFRSCECRSSGVWPYN